MNELSILMKDYKRRVGALQHVKLQLQAAGSVHCSFTVFTLSQGHLLRLLGGYFL